MAAKPHKSWRPRSTSLLGRARTLDGGMPEETAGARPSREAGGTPSSEAGRASPGQVRVQGMINEATKAIGGRTPYTL
jgi:hypothetical protein